MTRLEIKPRLENLTNSLILQRKKKKLRTWNNDAKHITKRNLTDPEQIFSTNHEGTEMKTSTIHIIGPLTM